MNPRPLHHWKSFWLGLLVLVLLGWSWSRARSLGESLYLAVPKAYLGLVHGEAGLGLFYSDNGSIQFGWSSHPNRYTRWFPESPVDAAAWRGHPLTGGGWMRAHAHLYLAHWLIILLFLVAWVSFLFWRSRRMKRLGEILELRTLNTER